MDSIELAFAGAAEQARMLATGEVTAPALIDLYLERIARLDPELRAYRVVFADSARETAAAAQERLDAGERLPLLGVPIAIKDDVDVAGEVTTYGGTAHGPAPTKDAEVVRLLREAGAVLLGKTAVPEMMIWPFTETVAFGATHNPWDVARTPGGSSGGSAAAVAAGLAPLALGSDGAGSIRIPATWCGLFGIKPQRDRVPLAPHDDAWCGMVANGPLAHTVEDAALFLDVTCDKSMPGPEGGFVRASSRPPNRLRIALSTKVPPLLTAHRDAEQRAAVHQAGAGICENSATTSSFVISTTRRRRCTGTCCPGSSVASTTMCAPCPTRSGWTPGPVGWRASVGSSPMPGSPRSATPKPRCRRECCRSSMTSTW